MPDGSGAVYTTCITVDCYDSDAVLENIDQLLEICVNMEHSYLGDLEITIQSPNGQEAILKAYASGGGGTYLGGANDDGSTTPGTGADYCFAMSGPVTLVNGPTITAGTNPPNNSIRPGIYLPDQSFDALLGSPINGDWCIEIVDNLAIDNGYVFSWGLDFDPALEPPELSFTPVTTSSSWDSDDSIISMDGATITVAPTTDGIHCYTYRATDDFGCEYNKEVCIEVYPEIIYATPDNYIECGVPPYEFDLSLNETVVMAPISTPTDFNYSLHLTQSDADNNVAAIPLADQFAFVGTDGQEIFIRLEIAGAVGCYETTSFILNIADGFDLNPVPDLFLCDDLSNDGFEAFDLEVQTLGILGVQDPVLHTVSYHLTADDALTGVSALTSPYTTTANPQPIFVRVESVSDADCFTTSDTPHFNLIVDPRALAITPPDLAVCDEDTDGVSTFDFSSYDALVLGTQDPANFTVSYYETQADADAATGAIVAPYTNIVANQQPLFVRVEEAGFPNCYSTTTFDLIVNPLPSAVVPTPLEVCDDGIPDGFTAMDLSIKDAEVTGGNTNYTVSYHLTQLDADLGQSALTLPYTNISNPQTIFVRLQDVNTGCSSTTTLDLAVAQAAAATTPDPLTYCDADNDGYGTFMLTDLDAIITAGVAGVTVTYHETQADADNSVNALSSPYSNIVIDSQTLFARVESATVATDCATVVPVDLVVYPTPVVPTDLEDYTLCDVDYDGSLLVDLTAMDSTIYGTQDPSDFILTYHFTQADAEAIPAISPILNVTNFNNTANPQTLWVRLESVANGCVTTGTFDVVVNLPPVLVSPTPLALCDDAVADQQTVFDLTVKDTEITAGDGSLEVVYYPTLADAESGLNAIVDPTAYTNTAVGTAAANPQTLHVRVTNLDTGCYAFTTLTIRVLPNPTPGLSPEDLVLCDDNSSGDAQEVFDLTQNELYIINGELNVSATYHETLVDAESGDNAIADPAAYTNSNTPFQTIYVRVTNDLTGCYTIVDFDVIVNPLPQAAAVADIIICELETDDIYSFDLEQQTALVLAGQDPLDFAVTYHATQAAADAGSEALLSPYTNITDPQTIYVNVTNTLTGCQNTSVSFVLEVQEAAQATTVALYDLCDDAVELDADPSNDRVIFDLSSQDAAVLNGQDPASYTVSYYATQADADQGVNTLSNAYENVANPQIIFARVDNDTLIVDPDGVAQDSSVCYATATVTLAVNALPIIDLEDSYTLCVDTNGTEVLPALEIDTGLSDAIYSFQWFNQSGDLVGISPSYSPTQGGNYSVEVSFTATACSDSKTFQVNESAPPVLNAVVTTLAFANTHVIEATATGIGVYEFAIDQGPWQSSGTFVEVSGGIHRITARDLNGCGQTTVEVLVIDYPLFFTPNGDGYHDTWNITALSNQPNSKIYIFDRYGKLLKQIYPSGEGWDGTYIGTEMPSNDYWFKVLYQEPTTLEIKEFKSHFTLKR